MVVNHDTLSSSKGVGFEKTPQVSSDTSIPQLGEKLGVRNCIEGRPYVQVDRVYLLSIVIGFGEKLTVE